MIVIDAHVKKDSSVTNQNLLLECRYRLLFDIDSCISSCNKYNFAYNFRYLNILDSLPFAQTHLPAERTIFPLGYLHLQDKHSAGRMSANYNNESDDIFSDTAGGVLPRCRSSLSVPGRPRCRAKNIRPVFCTITHFPHCIHPRKALVYGKPQLPVLASTIHLIAFPNQILLEFFQVVAAIHRFFNIFPVNIIPRRFPGFFIQPGRPAWGFPGIFNDG